MFFSQIIIMIIIMIIMIMIIIIIIIIIIMSWHYKQILPSECWAILSADRGKISPNEFRIDVWSTHRVP